MKPVYWLYIFMGVTFAYFAGMALGNDLLQFVFKPLLITTLLGYFISATDTIRSSLKKWIIPALSFSITGDSLLLFANNNELFFILGLASFLIAHIFYIISFHQIKITEEINGLWYTAIIVGVYYFFILSLLLPYLGTLKIPVVVYGLVISFMLFVALQLYSLKNIAAGRHITTGAILFVVSDSVLALNKFYHPLVWGGWAIMITYILAQWLLVRGLVRYITLMP